MHFDFNTISEFHEYFRDERTCYQFLESLRWEDGQAVCPHCGSTKTPYNVKARGRFTDIPSYRCSEKECDIPFTVRTGSIFQGSKVELKKWLQAAYELSISKKGISSVELGERIGVSQKTAWLINHKLRAMLKDTAPELLTGMVEADETYVGGKNKNRHKNKRVENSQGRSAKDKTPVFGLLQRGGKVAAYVVPNTKAATLIPIIKGTVDPKSLVVTDEYAAYNQVKANYEHKVVKHSSGQYVDGIAHTNSVEGFWSLLKRGVIGTFHFVSPQHLQRYCDEFTYRYNTKNATTCQRFNDTIKRFDSAQLTYSELTQNKRVGN